MTDDELPRRSRTPSAGEPPSLADLPDPETVRRLLARLAPAEAVSEPQA